MSTPDAPGQAVELRAADGERLGARVFEPTQPAAGQVLVAGALGVTQRFYAPFAAWLAARGYRVMTFDPRGMGASRRPEHRHSLRGLDADLLTWARLDFAAAVGHLCERGGGLPVGLVGHSLGVHHAAMTDAQTQARLAVVVSVAAGAGHWRDWAAPSRRRAPLLLHLAGPVLTPLFGYFPGRRLRLLADLPGPAMQQWSRWCRHPGFAWGAEPEQVRPALDAACFPLAAFSFTDDEAMTEACTRTLLQALPQVRSTLRVLSPGEVGLRAIGHLGAFRPEAAQGLWPLFEAALRPPP